MRPILNKNLRMFLCVAIGLFAGDVQAAKVDTVETYSQAMNKKVKAVVITPENYGKQALPVLYLLHGHGGGYADWIRNAPAIISAADQYQFIIVAPDGGINSWYWDSPLNSAYKYETYVSKELVAWIDQRYRTIANRAGRAIAGMSMGGQGAFYNAFRHQDVFGAAGSIAGGVDIRHFPEKWGMASHLGSLEKFPERWDQFSIINQVHLLKPGALALIMDCGTEDFFYPVNVTLHNKLLELKIPHDFIVRPGVHKWAYGATAIPYQLLFFHLYFQGKSDPAYTPN